MEYFLVVVCILFVLWLILLSVISALGTNFPGTKLVKEVTVEGEREIIKTNLVWKGILIDQINIEEKTI